MGTKRVFFALSASVLFLWGNLTYGQGAGPLLEGLEAYARKDWASSILFFKKTVSSRETSQPEAWYWLIMSEISALQYQSALTDIEYFLAAFKTSRRLPEVQYQYGRVLYLLQRREDSIREMDVFCRKYPEHELYSSALFWIGESLYDMGSFDHAKAIYGKITAEFTASPKFEASRYRMALIDQQRREYELLLLLKETHETALRSAEEFERRSRNYEQAITAYQKRIADILKDNRVAELEKELAEAQSKNAELLTLVTELKKTAPDADYGAELERLRQKALQVQKEVEKTNTTSGESP